ncbi:hypothetical protein JOC34_000849 [Virgibacillus halotolerans]|uniref:hypothetical protein n=1 Tax=Virgibacillus halotolerans TaxID=1071053 RepID=UPI0019608283|nr:hypothetical protein [Virgibacillus halotolerans]MBM7598492.1 hypothetical protein [Virgibacillus halotolerans]
MENNSVYIQTIEAADIHSHMVRGNNIKSNYVGMLVHSLESIKLKKVGLTTFIMRKKSKQLSNDIINVRFNQNVKSGQQTLGIIPSIVDDQNDRLEKAEDKLNKAKTQAEKKKLNNDIERIHKSIDWFDWVKLDIEENGTDEKWDSVTAEDLRYNLYENGCKIDYLDYDTGEITTINYKFYKRSSAKSRKGEALMINVDLYDTMIKWSHMGLTFKTGAKVDLPGLKSYDSLVMSGIEDTITIDPDSILIVDDVKLPFKETVNVVEKVDGKLESVEVEGYTVVNEIFDGQAMLDSGEFDEGTSMKLLRSHFFKAAAFSANLQLFFEEYAEANEKDYDNWYLTDMFNNEIKVTEIKLIINPSCLKALKFHEVTNGKANMYEVWKQAVRHNNNEFGVVKHDKGTKLGYTEEEIPLHNTSYQMLNTLPANKEDMLKLSQRERDYIMDLKNEDKVFIEYLETEKNDINSNQMFVDLYNKNNNIVNTEVFRNFRKSTIKKYVDYVKGGKLLLEGDYVTLFSCGVEYLYHAVGETITKPMALTGNQVYTKVFGDDGFNETYTGFRSPHTSMNNVLQVQNVRNDDIERYFNLSPHVVMINTIGFNVLNILNGADMDSDTMILFKNPTMNKLGGKCFGHYNVCENGIADDPTEYVMTNYDLAEMDNLMAESKTVIGETSNLAQIACSLIWDKLNNDASKSDSDVVDLMKRLDILAILSNCAIDNAKRQYDVKLNDEIRNIRGQLELKTANDAPVKPNFWKYVQNVDHTKNKRNQPKLKLTHYDCPMDYLYEIMNNLGRGKKRNNIGLNDLLVKADKNAANRRQIDNTKDMAKESQKASNAAVYADSEEEMLIQLEDVMGTYDDKFNRLKINKNTMYSILYQIANDDGKNGGVVRLMNHLYKTQKTIFMNSFKEVHEKNK